jgi:hypothetical protein
MLQLAPGALKQRLTQPGVYFFVALWVGQVFLQNRKIELRVIALFKLFLRNDT